MQCRCFNKLALALKRCCITPEEGLKKVTYAYEKLNSGIKMARRLHQAGSAEAGKWLEQLISAEEAANGGE